LTFLFGKLLWTVVQPGNLFLLCLLAGVLLFLLSRGRRGKAMIGVAAIGLALFAIAPIGQAMLLSLEGAVDPALSLAYGETVFNSSVARVLSGIALARRHPEAKLALIGGEGGYTPVGLAESRATLGFVVEQGIDAARVILEERSRSTHENATYAKAAIRPEPGETWVLVTSAFHMPRAVASFAAMDWPVIPYPVDYKVDPRTGLRPNFNLVDGLSAGTLAGKEWAGLLGYRLMGWTRQLFPAPAEIKSRSAR
jgi:uncharacterized SAM-binding protein YcdF (DUF218 family)